MFKFVNKLKLMKLKNSFYIAFCSVLILLTSCIKEQQNDLSELNLKGQVNSILKMEYTAKEKFGEITKDSLKCDYLSISSVSPTNCIKKFNKFGNLIEKISLYGSKPALTKKIYYNEKNKISYEDIFEYGDGELNSKVKYEYNDRGCIAFKQYDKNGEVTFSLNYILDNKGRIEKTLIDKTVLYSFSYDGDTLIGADSSGDTWKSINGIVIFESKKNELVFYKKNEFNDIIEERHIYNHRDTLTAKYEYKYDGKNNWIEKKKYMKNFDGTLLPISIAYQEISYDNFNDSVSTINFYNKSNQKVIADNENKLKDERIFCNENRVKEEIQKYFVLNKPDFLILENTIQISKMNDCTFMAGLTIKSKFYPYNNNIVKLKFNYNDDFSGYYVNFIN